jgi:very-short-patch-repair endonuclease
MKTSKNSYNKLSDAEKKDLIEQWYIVNKLSFADIATKFDTYANKIRRDAKKFNLEIRDKSKAQKNALTTGKHNHPTKGQTRSESTKQKIGFGVMQSWDGLTEKELEDRKEKAKLNWEKLDNNVKINMQQSAIKAVRETSKTGSKLEKFIHKKLLSLGYQVQFHKEQSLITTKLQIDIFLPTINTAIEVDGPSHFEPVWGEKSLARNIGYDQKKEGLITGRGWHLIRIKQLKDYSPTRASEVITKLIPILERLSKETVPQKINIED